MKTKKKKMGLAGIDPATAMPSELKSDSLTIRTQPQ